MIDITPEIVIYLGGYAACLLAVVVACIYVWRTKRLPQAPFGLGLFGLALMLETTLQRVSTFDRMLAYWGGSAVYLLAQVVRREWVRPALRWVGIVVAGVTIFEAVLTRSRPVYLANPNMVGAWLLLLWPWMPAPLAAAALLATQSRTAIAGFVLAWLAQQLQQRSRLPVSIRIAIVLTAFLLIPWLALLRPETVNARIETYLTAIKLTVERPLFGWGPGSFYAAAQGASQHADSAPLTIAAEMGLVGLAAAGALWFAVGRRAYRSNSPARWALLALAVQNIADDTWLWPWVILLAAVNAAWLEDER